MTTWSFRATVTALALTALTACEDGQGGAFLGGLGSGPNVALSQATMAFGAVKLVPPSGFCIDRRSLKQRFALMARCDKLGAPSAAADAPLGIITVSFSAIADGAELPTPAHTAQALSLQDVSSLQETENSVVFRANGPSPIEGMASRHWRANTRVGDQLMGLALYGPEDGRAVSHEGRDILSKLIAGSKPAS
jgi:hypothetical protein